MTTLLAQTAGGTDPLPLVGYGALGIIVLAAFAGYIWFKPAVDELRKRAEKAEAQRDLLLDVLTKEVTPVLTANVATNTALKPVLEDVIRALDRIDVPVPARRPRGRPDS